MKLFSTRFKLVIQSASLAMLGTLAAVTSASALPATTLETSYAEPADKPKEDNICINYTLYYAICESTLTYKDGTPKKVITRNVPIAPYDDKDPKSKAAAGQHAIDFECFEEAKKIRAELNAEDKKNGGSGDTKGRIKMDNKLVRIVKDPRRICIPRIIFSFFGAGTPTAEADGEVSSSGDSEFDPSLLSEEEIDSLIEQGATDESLGSSSTTIDATVPQT